MTSYALVEFRAIPLHPAPYGRVVSVQTTFLEQLFDISQPKRVPEIPADGAQNELGFGLPPFEDRWPGQHLGLFRLPGPVNSKLATQPLTTSSYLITGTGNMWPPSQLTGHMLSLVIEFNPSYYP